MRYSGAFTPRILLGIIFLVSVFLYTDTKAQQPALRAQKGILDLRNTDPERQHVALGGEWKFYWMRLVEPQESVSEFEYVDLPRLWSQTEWKKQSLPTQGYASYALDVLLPDSTGPLALDLPDVYTTYRLYANGNLLAGNGMPGTSKETSVPYWSPKVVPLASGTDTLRLILQVSNFHHAKGGPYKDIVLGPLNAMLYAQQTELALDIFLAGCLFMGGLFFIGLFMFGRHDQTLLYFSLFAILYSYRVVGTKHYALHTLFPSVPWSITLHGEYLSLYLSVGMFVMYTWKLYPQDAHRRTMQSLFWTCMAFALVTLLLPAHLFTNLVTPFLIVMVVFIPYAMFVYWRALQNHRTGARFALMSTGALMLVFISILLEYFGMAAPGKVFLFAGYVGFFFMQSLILSYRFATALKKARDDAEMGLKAKSDFLSTMSHEIRTPLNSVIGMTHLLLRDTPRPDQKQQLDVLLFSANNLLTIVNDILDYNKIEAGMITFSPAPMDLIMICRNIVSGYSKSATDLGLTLQARLDPEFDRQVIGDHTRMSQVISNLVQNAIKFTPKGSVTLHLVVKSQTEDTITIHLSVEDTGIGIAPEKQQEIFDRFTQVDSSATRGFGGTGLGLAITKRILELQQAELHLQSEPGVGSTFSFTQTFPLVPRLEEVKAKPDAVAAAGKPLQDISVLVVEDNKMNILVVQSFLKRWGAEYEIATNGEEALAMFDANRHDLVLMDLHMPVMDGYEATRLLRERGAVVPIVALTASLAQEVQEKVYQYGFNDIVMKPFNPDGLQQVISTYVEQKIKA